MESRVAPVRDWYCSNASRVERSELSAFASFPTHYPPVAMSMSVVPVSTMPDVNDRIVLLP